VGRSVYSRVFAAILSRSEHCAAAFFAQGAKNYTDVKLILFYRLILETYIIFVRKNNFLSPSVYCPDTSKRVLQIVTATETEWRNRFVRDWTETKRAKNHDTLRHLKERSAQVISPPTWMFWFVFGLLCRHTASNLITSGTHASWSKETPTPGVVSYLLWSLIKDREEEPPWRIIPKIENFWVWFFRGGLLPPGSLVQNIVYRKPPSSPECPAESNCTGFWFLVFTFFSFFFGFESTQLACKVGISTIFCRLYLLVHL